MMTNEYYNLPSDAYGWRFLPGGGSINLGRNVIFGRDTKIGHNVIIDDGVYIGDGVTIGDYTNIAKHTVIGSFVEIERNVKLGHSTEIRHNSIIRKDAIIRDSVRIGAGSVVGQRTVIGPCVILGAGATTSDLNNYFISVLPEVGTYWKWVDSNLKSLGFGGADIIQYKIGKEITEERAVISDIQCDVGLHVVRVGIQPEFVGLFYDTKMVCLEVEVRREDVCFGGLPGNDQKLRVKKLKVLRKIQVPKLYGS